MSEIEDLLGDIEKLREKLINLINDKDGDLLDSEVVTASKKLNDALNEYNRFLDKKFSK